MGPSVVVVSTGGTIASRFDPLQGKVVAARSGEDLLEMVPRAKDIAGIEVENFCNIGSYQLSPDIAFRLVRRIDEILDRPDVMGVVVTHGTDTMEETCYLADLLVASEKPIVFTGAQRSSDDPDSDGPRNLLNAIRAAASPLARGLGAMICFNDELHAARDVTKVHTAQVQTFQSYDHGMLGEIDGNQIVIYRKPTLRRMFQIPKLEERVDLILLVLGIDARYIDASIQSKAAGIVLEAFGRGNANTVIVDGVRRAVNNGIPVIVTSRCPAGRVAPIYGGGGGKDLEEVGAIFAGDLSGMKARILLMVLLADPHARLQLREVIAEMAP
jgi:L-asparaginase